MFPFKGELRQIAVAAASAVAVVVVAAGVTVPRAISQTAADDVPTFAEI